MTNDDLDIVGIEYIDYDEMYGFFGKVVARSNVESMSPREMAAEASIMCKMLGPNVRAVLIYGVPALS
jgi:hypothetical protein